MLANNKDWRERKQVYVSIYTYERADSKRKPLMPKQAKCAKHKCYQSIKTSQQSFSVFELIVFVYES